MSYNWDLIQRLLHEVQASANDTFKPRRYAEEHAAQLESEGKPMPNLDSLRAEAADYESLLFEGGFIVARPEEQGGNGENFVLTERRAAAGDARRPADRRSPPTAGRQGRGRSGTGGVRRAGRYAALSPLQTETLDDVLGEGLMTGERCCGLRSTMLVAVAPAAHPPRPECAGPPESGFAAGR